MSEAATTKGIWYADGLRWIGSLFHGAAEHLERRALDAPLPDPRALREADQYVNDLRTRIHIHF